MGYLVVRVQCAPLRAVTVAVRAVCRRLSHESGSLSVGARAEVFTLKGFDRPIFFCNLNRTYVYVVKNANLLLTTIGFLFLLRFRTNYFPKNPPPPLDKC